MVPSEDGLDQALKFGIDLSTLQWLEQLGLVPSVRGANFAITKDHPNWEILDWLAQRNILPNHLQADIVIKSQHTIHYPD